MEHIPLHEPHPGAWSETPWPLAIEIANSLPNNSWMLVGGLMVQTHAYLNSIHPGRETTDVDFTVRLESGKISFSTIFSVLRESGFSLLEGTKYAYRFTRGNDTVDIMVSEQLAKYQQPTHMGRKLLGVPGSTRAFQNLENIQLNDSKGSLGFITLPNLQGALVLKGAAYAIDNRDGDRHLKDGLTLLACVKNTEQIREGLSQRSRSRIRSLLKGIANNPRIQVGMYPETLKQAEEIIPKMNKLFDIYGTDNSATNIKSVPLDPPRTPQI